jgi:hypothetical protein
MSEKLKKAIFTNIQMFSRVADKLNPESISIYHSFPQSGRHHQCASIRIESNFGHHLQAQLS